MPVFLKNCNTKNSRSTESSSNDKSTSTGWEYNNYKNGGFEQVDKTEQETGPGLVLVEGGVFTMGSNEEDVMKDNNAPRKKTTVATFYMDETEVTNQHWLEYMYWMKRVYNKSYPHVYKKCLPDTLAWRKTLGYREKYVNYYLRHPSYRDYPVVGVSWIQANEFCKWRTDRVNEAILVREGIIQWHFADIYNSDVDAGNNTNYNKDMQSKPENMFSTENYLNGNYTVKVTDANGCTATSEFTKIIAPPSTNAINTTVCMGQTVVLTTDASSFTNPTYQWLNAGQPIVGANSATFTASTTGQFSVKVTDATAGASISCPISVTVNALPQVNLIVSGGTNVCFGTPVSIATSVTGTPNYTYQWQVGGIFIPNEQRRELLINESGIYNVKVSDANGCVKESDASTIVINPTTEKPRATILVQPDCVITKGIIAIDVVSGHEYSLDGTNYYAKSTFDNLAAGTYHLTAKNASNCISADTVLTIYPQPITPAIPQFTIQQTTCNLDFGTLNIQAQAGLTYSINQTDYTTQTFYANLAPGIYTLNAKNEDGCISADTTFTIAPKPLKPVRPLFTVLQPDCNVAFGSISVTPKSGEWYTIDGTNYQNTSLFANLTPGIYNLRAKNTDGCESDDFYITISPEPVKAFKPIVRNLLQPSCPNALGTLSIESNFGESYSIDGLDYTNTSGVFTDILPGDYTIFVEEFRRNPNIMWIMKPSSKA